MTRDMLQVASLFVAALGGMGVGPALLRATMRWNDVLVLVFVGLTLRARSHLLA